MPLHRRILLFPQGNANGQSNDMVSVYLDYANPKTAPEGWHACAQFCLAISNPWDPTIQTSSRESRVMYILASADARQMHIIDLSLTSAIGDLRVSSTFGSCIVQTRPLARHDRRLRAMRWRSPHL